MFIIKASTIEGDDGMIHHSRRSLLKTTGLVLGGTALAGTGLSMANTTAETASQLETDWPMLDHDPQGTGFNPGGAAFTDLPFIDWSRQIASVRGAPAIADGVAYLGGTTTEDGTTDGTAVAVGLDDGQVRWQTQLGSPIQKNQPAPTIVGDTVYLSGARTVYALSRTDGTVRWSTETQELLTTAPTVVDGTLYVATEANTYALDATEGTEQWQAEIGVNGSSYSRVAADGDTVVVGSSARTAALSAADGSVNWTRDDVETNGWPTIVDNSVVVTHDQTPIVEALNVTDGSTRWETEIKGPDVQLATGSPVRHGGMVIVPTVAQTGGGAKVTALNVGEGSVAWTIDLGSRGEPALAAATDGIVYLTVQWQAETNEFGPVDDALETGVWAINPADGSVLWKLPMRGPARVTAGGGTSTSASVPTADTVSLIDGDSYLYTLTASDPTVAWRFDADAPVRSAPSVRDTTVFVGDQAGTFYAVNAEAGEERWRHEITESWVNSVIANDRVVAGSDGDLFAFDTETGDVQWQFAQGRVFAVSQTVIDGTVYVANLADEEAVRAIDVATGEVRWTFSGGELCPGLEDIEAPPVVAGDRVYVAGAGQLWALNRDDGSPAWFEGTSNLRSMAVDDGTVFYGAKVLSQSEASEIHAVNAADGSERWTLDLDGSQTVKSLTAREGSVYAMSTERVEVNDETKRRERLHAVDADGTLRWTLMTDPSAESIDTPLVAEPTVANGTVFASGNRRLYAVNATDGSVIERFETTGSVHSTPRSSGNSVFVGSDDTFLYRFVQP